MSIREDLLQALDTALQGPKLNIAQAVHLLSQSFDVSLGLGAAEKLAPATLGNMERLLRLSTAAAAIMANNNSAVKVQAEATSVKLSPTPVQTSEKTHTSVRPQPKVTKSTSSELSTYETLLVEDPRQAGVFYSEHSERINEQLNQRNKALLKQIRDERGF